MTGSPRRRLAVLVATILIVVVAVAGAPYVRTITTTETTAYPEYDAATLVPERTVPEGEISPSPAPPEDARGTVLIDTRHANRFDRSDIRPLEVAITEAGYRVQYTGFASTFEEQLGKADAYIVIDPGQSYRPREVEPVRSFTKDGGRLLIVGEPTQSALGLFGLGITSVQSQVSTIAEPYGISFGSAYLYNMEENDGNYLNVFGEGTGSTPLADGVSRVAVYTATHVTASDGQTVVTTTANTRNSRTDRTGRYPLAVVSGNVMAIGDKSFIFESTYSVADNEVLLSNVVGFLLGGDRTRDLLDYPYVVDRDPTVAYTRPELLGAAQTVQGSLGIDRGTPDVVLERDGPAPGETDVVVTTFEDLARQGITGTGVRAGGGRVSVGSYESDLDGVAIIHAPESGYDLIVAADSPERVQEAATTLAEGGFDEVTISERTAVIRDEADTDGDTTPPGDGTETVTPTPTGDALTPPEPANQTPTG